MPPAHPFPAELEPPGPGAGNNSAHRGFAIAEAGRQAAQVGEQVLPAVGAQVQTPPVKIVEDLIDTILLVHINVGVLIGLNPACYVECPQSGSIGAQPVYSVFWSSQIRE